jgi:hypothetical protein
MPRDDDDYDDRPTSRRRRPDEEEDDRPRRRRWGDEDDEHDFRKRELPHSRLGIVSCAVAAMASAAFILAIVITSVSGLEDDLDAALEAGEPMAVLIALLAAGAVLLCLAGAVLAVAGLAQQERNKTFAVAGLCVNGLFFLCGGGLMLLGAVAA